MKKYLLITVLLGSSAFVMGGCSSNAANGAAIGSLVGAGIGKSTANHRDKRAVIGAVVGGAVGAAVGSEKDRAERQQTSTAPVSTSYSDSYIRHTHHYGSKSETHTHEGGNVEHSHQQQYYRSAPVVYVNDNYYYDRGRKGHRRHHRHYH